MSYHLYQLLDAPRLRECRQADAREAAEDAGHPLLVQFAIAIGKQTYPRLCFSVYAPSQSEAGIRHVCLKAHVDERMVVRRVRT